MNIKNFSSVFLLVFSSIVFSQNYQLSSHILDTSIGKSASSVKITLSKLLDSGNWIVVDEKITDNDGRIKDFLKVDNKNNQGVYKLTYHTKEYFDRTNRKSFYPYIDVIFEINDNEYYHVPITLNPYGYSTYRGS